MIFFKQIVLEFLSEDLFFQQVSASYTAPSNLVFICRADPSPCCSYLEFAPDSFYCCIQPFMIRHYEMRIFTYKQIATIFKLAFEPQGINLFQQNRRIYHNTISYDTFLPFMQYTRWNKVEDKFLFPDYDSMPCVIAALKSYYHIGILA